MKTAFMIVAVHTHLARNLAEKGVNITQDIADAAREARAQGKTVIWACMDLSTNGKPFQARNLQSTNGLALMPEPEDWIVPFPGTSVLENPDVVPFLRREKIKQIIFAGFSAADMTYATACHARSYTDDFNVIVAGDLIADGTFDAAVQHTMDYKSTYEAAGIPFVTAENLGLKIGGG